MKKNKMMRLASALLVLVLLTTCAISGTFAKYVTTHNGSDSARVAKWGVTAVVKGSLFSDSYKDVPTEYTANEQGGTITVQAETEGANVVAPGTKNEEGMTFVLTGTPEVDVKIDIVVTGKNDAVTATDVVLPAGTYTDYTKVTGVDDSGNPTYGQFTLTKDYHPLVFTLTSGDYSVSGTLAEIETALEGLTTTYHTNTDLSKIATADSKTGNGTYKLTWAWAFEATDNADTTDVDEAAVQDAADTYLGNVIAGLTTDANAVTDVAFGISITATQVD